MSFLNNIFKTIERTVRETERMNRQFGEQEHSKRYIQWFELEPYFQDAWFQASAVLSEVSNGRLFSDMLNNYKEAKRKYESFNSYIGTDGVLDNFPYEILDQMVEMKNMYEELDRHFGMFIK